MTNIILINSFDIARIANADDITRDMNSRFIRAEIARARANEEIHGEDRIDFDADLRMIYSFAIAMRDGNAHSLSFDRMIDISDAFISIQGFGIDFDVNSIFFD